MTNNLELSPLGLDILTHAVRISRDHQIRSVKELRSHLERDFPKANQDIDQAIVYWANYVKSSGDENDEKDSYWETADDPVEQTSHVTHPLLRAGRMRS